ncbi:PAS domain-containing sensor histidine kinase [Pontibacter sp. SGAir0037]|uniref:sensor histidine kinase n=1 Tax=Pontibacter sp. SGAir0037 TaxID=2571030 RepID=UPI0010CD23CF|nr:HAMP domain-containing sensor histidine kinase [Pontibacter sp. SGAir0037]QCR22581.1 ATP-binding protein [Pontibacter sp. SGAir0037]
MNFKGFKIKLILRVLLLCITLSTPSIAIVNNGAELLVFILPLLLFQVIELIRFLHQAQDELAQFIEAVQYRDFSRNYNTKNTSTDLQVLRQSFNQINYTFKTISRERETQYQNLQKIMELVNTGILTYNLENGEVVLMNESLKKLLHVPFLKSIHALKKRDEALYAAVQRLLPGHTIIATAQTDYIEKRYSKVLLSATSFQNNDHTYKLVAFQNINEALDETESLAWQKLLNVMTHEIMNSVAPISSLADTLKNRLHQTDYTQITADDIEDLEVGISTIKRRSEGLLRFAETYRNLNKITTLNLEHIAVKELFSNLKGLMQPTLEQRHISLEIIVSDPDISLQADPNLLDQVLINLLVNAIEAVKAKTNPLITLSASLATDGKVVIRVRDNGTGMSKEVQEKIFIPFFSTKKQGSGIGLSLCKQIIMLHRGTIQVQSAEGEGTAFTLRFG